MLGLICRSDFGGLGFQTKNLARLLQPDRIMLIDSTVFNGAAQHPEWYASYDTLKINGFPTNEQCALFLDGLTHVMTAEIPYNYELFRLATQRGIRSYLQPNIEFTDYFRDPGLPQPTYFLAPSSWYLEELQRAYPGRVQHLPPPLFDEDFADVRATNLARTGKRRFLHVVGKRAVHDRNGTLSPLKALTHALADFELVITAQQPLDVDITDDRVRVDYTSPADNVELYRDYDALILPRRYGGLCLPMNEALMSGLPVIMTNVSPNWDVLPSEWRVRSTEVSQFMTRRPIKLYDAHPLALAERVDQFCRQSEYERSRGKEFAHALGTRNFDAAALRPKYEQALSV